MHSSLQILFYLGCAAATFCNTQRLPTFAQSLRGPDKRRYLKPRPVNVGTFGPLQRTPTPTPGVCVGGLRNP
ncbi:hypothetical protein PF005_g33217 [Phytophthora fragariae]|uniref:RxLR effector protein n=1 Tax=Phytophthora fragariae TaxID=53985 RepID=A0A6A3PLU9_9STRA|nr:hypothetical protein PF003_g1102 [Phytophthora fragariae]KAE8950592.1 hypothetical protein PF011_g33191 [Phytophthora fragariae]KAE9053677.1 hypothetical protein PF010_g32817 [Phytophthora fragariae]KAE9054300.1 hypothetical protein PF007_g32672 [Phytophthora fragariae]KAE9056945.1 hypothetical protein PF006_g32553 [Phytophthora fragariae]